MTHASNATAETRFAEGDFRVGRVLSRAISVVLRRFLTFFIVAFVGILPLILLQQVERDPAQTLARVGAGLGLVVLMMVLGMLSSAVISHGTFQDMCNRPANLAESLKVGLRRFLPLMGLGFLEGLLTVLGFILLIIPGLILNTMWFVTVAACVVERTGAWTSMERSRELTEGYRWKVFGFVLLLFQPVPSEGAVCRRRRDLSTHWHVDLDCNLGRLHVGRHGGHLLRTARGKGSHRHRADRVGVRLSGFATYHRSTNVFFSMFAARPLRLQHLP